MQLLQLCQLKRCQSSAAMKRKARLTIDARRKPSCHARISTCAWLNLAGISKSHASGPPRPPHSPAPSVHGTTTDATCLGDDASFTFVCDGTLCCTLVVLPALSLALARLSQSLLLTSSTLGRRRSAASSSHDCCPSVEFVPARRMVCHRRADAQAEDRS